MPDRIEPSELKDPRRVEEFYQISLAWGDAESGPLGRLKYFALAAYSVRKRENGKPVAINPGAFFTKAVKNGHWDWAQNRDDDEAERMVASLESKPPPPTEEVVNVAAALSVPDAGSKQKSSDYFTEKLREFEAMKAGGSDR